MKAIVNTKLVMKDGIWFGPDLNYDYRGYLCGSRIMLENGCRNMMTHTGYGLCHSIRMATINPARMPGIDDEVGSLEAGKKANLIIIDDAVRVKKVILKTYASAPEAGDRKVWFVSGADLLGDTDLDLCSVDGAHPTDIGFLRMADGPEPLLRKILYGT